MKRTTRVLACVLSGCMLLTGCGNSSKEEDKREIMVTLNETIDADSSWINSSIEGAIDENTPVNLKDDYYTYVNKDWIIEKKNEGVLDDDCEFVSTFSEGTEVLEKRMKSIISGQKDDEAYETNMIGFDQNEVDYDSEILMKFTKVAGDWDARNSLGVEPLKEYLAMIEDISSIDEMTEYMTDLYTSNFAAIQLVDIENSYTYNDYYNNHIMIAPCARFSLDDMTSYYKYNILQQIRSDYIREVANGLLQKCGYSQKETNRIIRNCFKLEGKIADTQLGISDSDLKDKETYSSLEETKKIFGNYPIEEIIKAYGYENPEGYFVVFPQSAKKIGAMYKESNLQMIKDYYILNTTLEMAPLLDRENYDLVEVNQNEEKGDGADGDTRDMNPEDEELGILLNSYIYKYMREPLDAVYVARYCSKEQKEALQELINMVIAYYDEMIDTEEWLSDETKEKTKEKLHAMRINVLYPEAYPSYADVDFSDEDNLVDMIVKLNLHQHKKRIENVGKPFDSTVFPDMSTTTMNAFYNPMGNSINILAGIVAVDGMYDLDDPIEVRLAHLGSIVGHEISHGFDNKGVQYNKDGKEEMWWNSKDYVSYATRTAKLQNHYSAIIPIPGGKKYSGANVSTEAIADMGGVKCMLGIAKTIDNFDYDLFFRSYAQLYQNYDTYDWELTASKDVHPVSMLRVNVVLQQFDEFYDTYDIKKGDGMYLDPDKRINVW